MFHHDVRDITMVKNGYSSVAAKTKYFKKLASLSESPCNLNYDIIGQHLWKAIFSGNGAISIFHHGARATTIVKN